MMDDKRLQEIKARAEAATPGPWELVKNGRYEDHDECLIELPDDSIELCRYENGEFIAHSRTDVVDLLSEVERLRAENDVYKADIEAGRLIRIPCREFYENAGGTAWFVWEGEVIETVQCGALIDAEGRLYVVLVCEDKIFPYRTPIAEYDMEMSDWCTNDKAVDAEDYQRTVFMTEEAARAALGEEREDG